MEGIVYCVSIFFLFVTSIHEGHTLCDPGICGPGEAFDGKQKCQPCPERHFQYMEGHACISCFLCSVPNSDQIVIRPCNRTTDTHIGCPSGSFINAPPPEIYCDPCRQCAGDEDEIAPCQGRENTKCASRTTISPVFILSTTTIPIPTTADSTSTRIFSSKFEDVHTITTTEEKQPDNSNYKVKDVDSGPIKGKNAKKDEETEIKVVAAFIITLVGLCLCVGLIAKCKDHPHYHSPV